MKKIFNYLCVTCTIMFIVSCATSENNMTVLGGVIKIDSMKYEFSDIDYLSKVDFFPIDSNKNAMFSRVSKVMEVDDLLCFVCNKDNKIVFFDSLGNYVNEVKRIGRGHGEYIYLNDVTYDPYNEELLLLAYPNSIIRLKKNGEYVDKELLEGYYNEISVDKDYIYLTNSTYTNNELSTYSLTTINKKTKEKMELLPLEAEYAPYCVHGKNLLKTNDGIIFTRKFDDHIYKLKNGEVCDFIEVDMSSLTFPKEKMDHQYDCVEITQLCAKDNYIYALDNVVETDSYILFSSNLGDINICDKSTMISQHYKRATLTSMAGISNMLYVPIEGSKYDFCFVKDNVSVSMMKQSIEKYKMAQSVDKKFIDALSSVSDNSTIVVLCKFK